MDKNATVEERIKSIVISRLKDTEITKKITYETPLLSLGIDSILALSILVEIEEIFNIEIDDADLNMDKVKNINAYANFVREYLNK
ncbi:phosphopantetheine-binding protein [Pelosinus baikalensis]|uniref:Phosphopantetheine-binding protein n=1 Tax=Pelosinus baikalensis TaxID=2892015 RepID=A0ABS8HTL2_9FIRM|nr:phosphopantetheine-binding protein [Pelosinus baikalensis]MCC5466518.1 phosphopantetheine-binding protein [Pelosinus baikalensis]